jgi:putative tryptophan/tyrosine transport system substrate-binding protein
VLRHWIKYGLSGLLCWCFAASLAQAATVTLVLSEASAGYVDVANAIAADLERTGHPAGDIARLTVAEWLVVDPSRPAGKVLVALGSEALKQVLINGDPRVPVVAALVPVVSFDRLVKDSAKRQHRWISAVYLDQPLGRRLDLLRLALPDAKRVGVLWGPDSVSMQNSMAQASQTRSLLVQSSEVASPGSLFSGLSTVLEGADVLFAVADPQVYSSATIANILRATYRAGIPMVAFSPAYVRAGALMAIYATPSQIGVQAAGLTRLALQGGSAPPSQYPVEFEISVNAHVARSLGLQLDAKTLTEKLHATVRRP